MKGSGVVSTGQAYSLEGANMTPTSEYRNISLTRGQVAKVDAEDYEWISQWKWQAVWNPHTQSFYANRCDLSTGKRVTLSMHRQVLGLPWKFDGRHADHINHDTLDNRQKNLRAASTSENSQNRRKRSDNVSGTTGVYLRKDSGKWRANIFVAGKRKNLGDFPSFDEAVGVRRAAEREIFGDFAFARGGA